MKSGWVTKKLGEVCVFRRGLTYSKSDEVEHSSKVVLRANNISLETNQLCLDELKYIRDDFEIPDDKYLEKNCLLICTASGSKAHLGKVAYIDREFDFAFGGFMGLIIPDESQLFPRYFYYTLTSEIYRQFIQRLTDGANINNLKFTQLAEFDIPIPPLAEQKRIVAKIDAAFEKIDALKANAEKNLANAKELFQSALDEAMRPKPCWVEKRLGEVYEITSSKRVFKSEWKSAGIPFYRAREIVKLAANGSVKNELFVSEEMYETYAHKYGIPKAGDIMITGVGTLGVCYVVKEKDKFYFKDGNIIWLKKCSEDVDSEFVSLSFSTTPVRKQVLANAGTTVGTYTIIMAKNTIVQMPTIVEQKRIVNYVSGLRGEIETLQQNYARQIADCAEIRQAILREAFEGSI